MATSRLSGGRRRHVKDLLSSSYFCVALRWILGVTFLYAGIVKSQDPRGFAQAIYNYRLLPGDLINPMAILLPWVEIAIGTSLLVGIWVQGSSLLAMALLSVFAGALLLNLIRGLEVDCGCFSTRSRQGGNTIWYVFRDLLLLFAGVQVFLFDKGLGFLGRIGRKRGNQ